MNPDSFADECNLSALFRQRARDMGFKRGPLLDRVSLKDQFVLRFGVAVLKDLGLIGSHNAPSFVECLSVGGQQADVLRCAFLVDFLFGSLDSFADAVRQFSFTGDDRNRLRRAVSMPPYSEDRLASAIASVRSYVEANPGTTRSELLRNRQHQACYLLRHSRETYEKIAPKCRRRIGYRDSRSVRMAQLDDALLDYVRGRFELLRSGPSRDWRRLSVRALLLGHPSAKSFSANKDKLPKTRKFIEELIGMPL